MIKVFAHHLYPLSIKQFYQGLSILDKKEREEVGKYKYKKDQDRALFSRVLLKKILSQYSGVALEKIKIKRDDHGRPFSANKECSFWDFNVSHSGSWWVMALNNKGRVGIDIEECKKFDFHSLVDNFFQSQERAYVLQNKNNNLSRFYYIWTLKEAYLKAKGRGLSSNCLQEHLFRIKGDNKIELRNNNNWCFKSLDIGFGYQLSLCAKNNLISSNIFYLTNIL